MLSGSSYYSCNSLGNMLVKDLVKQLGADLVAILILVAVILVDELGVGILREIAVGLVCFAGIVIPTLFVILLAALRRRA